MRSRTLRLWLIGVLALAAVISVVGNKADSPWIGWLSFAVFLVAPLPLRHLAARGR